VVEDGVVATAAMAAAMAAADSAAGGAEADGTAETLMEGASAPEDRRRRMSSNILSA
jgi:hypothetical protein